MKNLKEAGYIVINSKGEIELTENGAKIDKKLHFYYHDRVSISENAG